MITLNPPVPPLCLLIVVLSGGQSRCYRWCRCCRHGRPLSSVAFVVRTRPLSPLPMADVISSPLPSQPALRRCPRLRRVLSSSSRCRQQSSPSAESSELSRRDSRLDPAILRFLGEGQCTITVVAAPAAVGDDADVRLCVIVIIVLIVTAIPPPSPQSRVCCPPLVCLSGTTILHGK